MNLVEFHVVSPTNSILEKAITGIWPNSTFWRDGPRLTSSKNIEGWWSRYMAQSFHKFNMCESQQSFRRAAEIKLVITMQPNIITVLIRHFRSTLMKLKKLPWATKLKPCLLLLQSKMVRWSKDLLVQIKTKLVLLLMNTVQNDDSC